MPVTASENNRLGSVSQLSNSVTSPSYKWFSLQNNKLDGTYHPIPTDGSKEVGWWGSSLSDANGLISTNPTVTFTFSASNVALLIIYGDNLLNEFLIDFDYAIKDASNNILDSGSITGNTSVNRTIYTNTECIAATSMTITIHRINKPNTVAKLLELAVGIVINSADIITPKINEVVCNATFARNSVAYNPDGSVVQVNKARFKAGKFGKGIMIEEGTTNMLANSSAVVPNGSNPANWYITTVSGTPTATWENGGFQGKCLRINCPSASDRILWQNSSLYSAKANQVYTLSGWLDTNLSYSLLQIQETLTGSSYIAHVAKPTGNSKIDSQGTTWYEYAVTFTTSASFTGWTWGIRADNTSAKAINYRCCDIQLEEKNYNTSYFRNDSTSSSATRQPETLTIPTANVLNITQGTVEFQFYVPSLSTSPIYIFDHNPSDNNNRLLIYGSLSGGLQGLVGNGSTSITTSSIKPQVGWNYIAIRWGSFGVKFTVNNTTVSNTTVTSLSSLMAATMSLGSYSGGTYQSIGAIYDDLRISCIARSDAEILNAYNSSQSLPIDNNVTYKMNFENNIDTDGLGAKVTVKTLFVDTLLPKIADVSKPITNLLHIIDALQLKTDGIVSNIHNIHSVMRQDTRQVFCKVDIVYTDPAFDGLTTVVTSDDNNISNKNQVFDGVLQPDYKWFSLSDNKLDGSYHLPDNTSSVGWWGNTMSNVDGTFDTPQTISIQFNPRLVDKLLLYGDSLLNCYAVDFDINLYRDGAIVFTQSVRNNTNVSYTQSIDPVGGISKIEAQIFKLNKQSVCKVLELFSLVTQSYTEDNLVALNLFEELAYEESNVPLGAVSSNELDLVLSNIDRKFDISNTNSPLYGMLRKNRKVTVWLGAVVLNDIEWHKLGTFWTVSWKAPFSDINAHVVARDRLELLRGDDFTTSQLYTNYSLYQLYELIFTSAGLDNTEYFIDANLQNIVLPYAWFGRMTYRDAIEEVSKCAFVKVYCDHDGIIKVMATSTGTTGITNFTTDNLIMDFNYPMTSTNITNSVEVVVNNLVPDVDTEIYSNKDTISIDANTSQDITCIYNNMPNISTNDPVISMDAGLTLTNVSSYVWGSIITIQNNTSNTLNVNSISIHGVPLKVKGKDSILVEDTTSIQTEGRTKIQVSSPFIQDRNYATELANTLLNIYSNQRSDISMDTRGDIALGIGEDILVSTDYISNKPYTVFRQNISWDGALSAEIDGKKI